MTTCGSADYAGAELPGDIAAQRQQTRRKLSVERERQADRRNPQSIVGVVPNARAAPRAATRRTAEQAESGRHHAALRPEPRDRDAPRPEQEDVGLLKQSVPNAATVAAVTTGRWSNPATARAQAARDDDARAKSDAVEQDFEQKALDRVGRGGPRPQPCDGGHR